MPLKHKPIISEHDELQLVLACTYTIC